MIYLDESQYNDSYNNNNIAIYNIKIEQITNSTLLSFNFCEAISMAKSSDKFITNYFYKNCINR